MSGVAFLDHDVLWLLLLLLPLWHLSLRALQDNRNPLVFWSSLLLRSIILIALIGSLAGIQLVTPANRLTTIFLVDQSDSISRSSGGRALAFVQEALTTMRAGDRAGIVLFGQQPIVERIPIEWRDLTHWIGQADTSSTNIEAAIQLGLALFPSDSQKRLVLLSDGGEQRGNAMAAVELAAARHIPVDVGDLSGPVVGDEALITHMEAPTYGYEGQLLPLTITIESTTVQSAVLSIRADNELIEQQMLHLVVGKQQVQTSVTTTGSGFRRYHAVIVPERDEHRQNNEVSALVRVQGPPRILLVASQLGDARFLHDALSVTGMLVETIAPSEAPTDLTGLSHYDAVVLVNVAVWSLPPPTVAAIPLYVRDLGRGLVMIGGTESYGVGGYGNTPIETALPVSMDVRPEQGRPNVAIVFLLDRSSSMANCHCTGPDRRTYAAMPGGEYKINIAKEAVVQAATLLNQDDILSILAFDSTAYEVFPPTANPDPDAITLAIAAMEPWGRTRVDAGLLKAEETLASLDAKIKHVVLLTDGWNEGSEQEAVAHPMMQRHYAIAERLRNRGVTLSTIAAGSGSAPYLAELARYGGGRYYPAEDMREVPTIFLKETVTVAGNYLIEQPFIPRVAIDSSIVQGLPELPLLYGHNGNALKPLARLFLDSPEQVPVLAGWNYGLGRSLAWTSDMNGRWARDWVMWSAFPRFADQLLQWVLPTPSSNPIETIIQMGDTQTTLIAKLPTMSTIASETVKLSALLIPSEAGTDSRTVSVPIEMGQIAHGSYEATISSPPPGTYLVQFVARSSGGAVVAEETAGLVVPYSSEYLPDQGNRKLLEAIAEGSGGAVVNDPRQGFAHRTGEVMESREIGLPLVALALLLFPFDVAIRRIV